MCDNYRSATNSSIRNTVEKQILFEVAHGHYQVVSFRPTIVSALGSIPKKGSDQIRLIHDCSRPPGRALNDFCDNSKFRFSSIQDAVDLLSPHYYMAKVDLKSAYRAVPIHPSDWHVTGLKWTFSNQLRPTYMVDTRLPFGASLSAQIFNDLSQAVCSIMHSKGYPGTLSYLDDYLVTGKT